jgi:twitching motility protein PilT
MAQLDQLISAMLQHEAEALVLQPGQKPSLVLGGTERPIVKSALTAAHVSRLTAEIAPADQRAAVAAGDETSFNYAVGGRMVRVQLAPGSAVRVTPHAPAPPAAPEIVQTTMTDMPPAAEESPVPAPETQAPRPPVVEPAEARPPTAGDAAPLDAMLHQLVERGGSDLHVSSGSAPMIRVDGELVTIDDAELSPSQVEQLLLPIAPERNREQFSETGDTDFAHEIEGLCRFRSNIFMDRKGPGGVFRVIPSKILTVDDLNLSQALRKLCFLTKGLVLVTGPTGSGKSTTLCALVDHINNSRRDHIITIEDPIEFVHPNKECLINQREVHVHTQGFKPALRAALREDPDVVLVGEMRDLETVSIAIETAETGHLVFGTLHTSSAVSTVDRIIDQFPADRQEQIRIMLSESLKAVIAQVLCKKIGGGRVAALEVLIVNAAVSNLIREGKTFQIPSIMQTSKAQGNVLLNAALLELVQKKLVEPDEAYVKAIDKRNLLSAFEKNNIKTDFAQNANADKPQPS